MSNIIVKQAIDHYLNAVEKKHGTAVRMQTWVKHADGTDLVLKQGGKAPQVIDLGTLNNLTNLLNAAD